jgi:hypothetical protein
MELVDRYLKAVKSYLPQAQRDDILEELSENIRSQIEDREAQLGRPLNEAEQEVILKQHGHPMLVAGRYRQDHRTVAFGRELIGPTLFPFYAKVLSINLGITSVILVIIFTALFAGGQPVGFSDLVRMFLLQMLIQFGVVTAIFTVVQMHFTKYPDRWDPRKADPPRYLNLAAPKDAQRVPRADSVSQFVVVAVMLCWLRAAQNAPFLFLGPAAAFLKLSPVWRPFYLPAVLVALAFMVQAGINVFRPDWVWLRSVVRVASDAASLLMGGFLLRVGPWIVLAETGGNPARDYGRVVEIINQCFLYSLWIALIYNAVMLVIHLRRLARPSQDRVPHLAL